MTRLNGRPLGFTGHLAMNESGTGNRCFDKVYIQAAGPSHEGRLSDQPVMAGEAWSDDDDDNVCYLVNSLLDLEGLRARNMEGAEIQSLL